MLPLQYTLSKGSSFSQLDTHLYIAARPISVTGRHYRELLNGQAEYSLSFCQRIDTISPNGKVGEVNSAVESGISLFFNSDLAL